VSSNSIAGKILIVEDEEVVAGVIGEFFRKHGYGAEIAQDGIRAKELLKKEKFRLILTDVYFYWSGGIDLIKTIREKDKKIPIVAMTGYGHEVAQEAIEAGANDVLLKPFDILQLKKMIGSYFDLVEVERAEKRFGILAVENGFISPNQLIKAINIQIMEDVEKGSHRLLGRILFDKGDMTTPQIDEILKSLGEIPQIKGPH
jgi:CheY-like chemotaxis protein